MMNSRILAVVIGSALLINLTGCEAAPPPFQGPTSAQSATAEKEDDDSSVVSQIVRPSPIPSSSAVPTQKPEKQSEKTFPDATPKPVKAVSGSPVPESTNAPVTTARPSAVPTAVPTPFPKQESTPKPTVTPTEKPKVWVVDVAGHYETVTKTVTEQVWIEEQGHYEETKTAIPAPMYTCNHCNAVFYSQDDAESHGWEEFEKGNAGTYTYQGNAVVGYNTEQTWVIDTPGHYEDIVRVIETEIWVEEVGHWE